MCEIVVSVFYGKFPSILIYSVVSDINLPPFKPYLYKVMQVFSCENSYLFLFLIIMGLWKIFNPSLLKKYWKCDSGVTT